MVPPEVLIIVVIWESALVLNVTCIRATDMECVKEPEDKK